MNTMYGASLYGRYLYAGYISQKAQEPPGGIGATHKFYPGEFTVVAYAEDGTMTAIFGSGIESNPLQQITFEITETGCGSCELTFKKLPTSSELNYMQRIDIHLFGDAKPWYSGYILQRPVEGTTDTTYKFTAHGYYNQLESIVICKTYTNIDPADIVKDFALQAEHDHGIKYNDVKVEPVGYQVTKLVFDGVTVKEALETLAEFAIDYVYGVNEYRELFFMPRDRSINEQARLTVGKHLNAYQPTWDVDKIYNWAMVRGGQIDEDGEQWLCTVQDAESIKKYGRRDKVLNLPEAYAVTDAKRWAENQIKQYKDPVKTAKVTGMRLEYPLPDGTFNVRHLSTRGEAEIRTIDGKTYQYPITKIKYTVSASKGISADLTLGEPVFAIDKYLASIERNAKNAEQSQSSAIKQLKL